VPDWRQAGEDMTLELRLLGGFSARVGSRSVQEGDWRLRKAKSLVKLLALEPGHRLHREQVMDLLWPDLDPEGAANSLNKALHAARRALEPDLVPGRPSLYLRLQGDLLTLQSPERLWVDVPAFEAAGAAARQAGDVEAYRSALELYRCELLPEDRYEEWADLRREELRSLHISLLLELARLLELRGEHEPAIQQLQQVVAADPAHEEAHASLMRVQALSGHRHQALRQYERLREALQRELGVDPEPSSRQLYQEILEGRLQPFSPAAPAQPDEAEERNPPLVDRGEELDSLEDALEALFAGRGGVILISGEAGSGKSRLASELVERVRRRGGMALVGASYEQEGRLPYGPFVEALDDLARRIKPAELRSLLGDAGPDLARLAPGIGAALGLSQPAPGAEAPDRQRLFAAVAGLLSRLAGQRPMTLVLDDLHAADDASLQLLHYLARTGRSYPLLILGTLRPEEAAPADPLSELLAALQRERAVVRLDLRRLSPAESEILVRSLLGGAPVDPRVFEVVYGLAEGNPFFTEEALGVMREGGQMEQRDGRWRLRDGVSPDLGPLAELVNARLAQLSSPARRVLGLAAVVGREVPYRLLQRSSDMAEWEMLDALDECLGRHVLEESPEGYRFGHPLHREALYAGLSRARRASLHGRVADTLEELYSGDLNTQAEALAHHYGLSDEPGRAVGYLIVAGDRAAAVYANEAALGHYRRATELLSEPGAPEEATSLRGQLWEKIGDLLVLTGESAPGAQAYRSGIAALQDGSHPVVSARLHRKAAHASIATQQLSAAEQHLTAARLLLAPRRDEAEWGRLRVAQAQWLWEKGRPAEALDAAEEGLTLAERHGKPADVAAAYEVLALVFHSRGEWKRGLHFQIQHLGASADDPRLGTVLDAHH
jgi:DNA-binding SARP family transcriptional activator